MGSKPRALTTYCAGSTEAGSPAESDLGVGTPAEVEQEGPPDYVVRDAVLLLWREVLNLMLEGVLAPSRIAERLQITTDLVRKVQDNTEFIKFWETAKVDMAVSAIDRVRGKAHIYMSEMEKLALLSLDPHVRRAALTDLLNRAGTAPSMKIEAGPSAYRKAVEKYIDVGPDKE